MAFRKVFLTACLVLAAATFLIAQSTPLRSAPLAAATQANPALVTLGEYVYAVPPGWTAQQYPDGIVLMSPASATNERCLITVWPMRPAGANLLADAYAVFQDVYK